MSLSEFGLLKEKGIRLVVAQALEDVKAQSRYHFHQLFGEDAFYDPLEEVVEHYERQAGEGLK